MTQDINLATTDEQGFVVANAIKDVRDSHGAAFAAAALATEISDIEGDGLSIHVGGHLLEVSNVIRHMHLESSTGITSTAMQELAAHLEAASNCLRQSFAKVNIFDRAAFLAALCNAEILGNSIAHVAGMKKVEADLRLIQATLEQAQSGEAKAADLSDLV